MSELNFSIVSPKGIFFKDKVDMVVLPSFDGDVGISNSDRSFTYILKTGVIYVSNLSRFYKRFFVSSGRYLADGDTLIIAVDDIDNLHDLDDIDISDIKNKINYYKDMIDKNNSMLMESYYKNNINVYEQLLASIDLHDYR